MKKFITRLVWVGAIFYTLLSVVQFGYDYYLRTSDDANHGLWNTIAKGEANADIIFVGSSRALVQYDPKIFEEHLGYKGYVLGLNSTGYDLQKVLRDLYLENNPAPKIIVQNVDIGSFKKTSNFFKPPYFPYYSFKTARTLAAVDDQAYYEWAVPMYKYRSYVRKYKNLFKIKTKPYYQGYMEMDLPYKAITKKPTEGYFASFDYDKGFDQLEKLIDESSEIGSDLYLVWAPEYIERLKIEEPYLSRLVKKFNTMDANNDHVYFLDFTRDSLNLDTRYFYNEYHLNKKGVQLFNAKVIDSIIMYQNLK